jgi:hypothetical protein
LNSLLLAAVSWLFLTVSKCSIFFHSVLKNRIPAFQEELCPALLSLTVLHGPDHGRSSFQPFRESSGFRQSVSDGAMGDSNEPADSPDSPNSNKFGREYDSAKYSDPNVRVIHHA